MMSWKEWVNKLVGGEEIGCALSFDSEGINFIFTDEQSKKIQCGQANELLMHQYIALQMVLEQGEAEELPNGMLILSSVVVQIDETFRCLLKLPPIWSGDLHADIRGKTGSSSFQVAVSAANDGGRLTHGYKVEGPTIRFSSEEYFLLSPAHFLLFSALEKHRLSRKTEYDNLSLILALQGAQKMGASISLGHFEKLNILAPDSITVEAELDEQGCLILTPQMGQEASHERVQKVLGQLRNKEVASLRVDNEIVLFDERRMQAVQEILRNRVVKKENVDAFLKNPTAFIDASLVDLELGFSARVRGVTQFRHAYFGETDESGIDWFGKKFAAKNVYPPKKLNEIIVDKETLDEFRGEFEKSQKTGAQELEFREKVLDVSDLESVNAVLDEIESKLSNPPTPNEALPDDSDEGDSSKEDKPSTSVVDIELNDDVMNSDSMHLESRLQDVLLDERGVDWSGYRRSPFPHQVIGVRWVIGLVLNSKEGGGLLADDMGLGKTFMSLAAMEHFYRWCQLNNKRKNPCLVVAPLSLLQIWKDEVGKTFKKSPFRDIVILQTDEQLKDYRMGGVETKNQGLDDEEAAIRYSLKVGSKFERERLDLSQRLVITTYQTLRDYQFSLCTVDWGMVVFDEAQNIKNPNALQTRAAKGLKADFRLVATGTPVENTLADFWCLMDTACPGYLDSYQAFRNDYITPILRAAGDEVETVREAVGLKLRECVGALMLRRIKEDNLDGLPSKTIFVGVQDSRWKYSSSLFSIFEGEQLASYDGILSNTDNDEQNMVLVGLQRLRDVSLHPRLVFGGDLDVLGKSVDYSSLMRESAKLQSVLAILDKIKQRQEKCIIFAVNKKLQAFLSLALARRYSLPALSVINGDAKTVAKRANTPTRNSMIKNFEAREGFNIILMSPVAAGVGLTVVGANNVIHFERHWNPAKEAQATDRVYRIGQKRNVNVYIPLTHHPEMQSFDVNLHQLLSKKSLLKDAVVVPEQIMPSPEGFDQQGIVPTQKITFEQLRRLSWQQFEALCAELLCRENQSTSCQLTNNGGDYGADAVLIGKDNVMTLVQCKHTSTKNYGGHKAVLQVSAAKIKYEDSLGKKVGSLVFVTNATRLSVSARKDAKKYSVKVIDGNDLRRILEKNSVTYQDVLNRLDKPRISV